MYHSQQHSQNYQFPYVRECFGYNHELFVCPSCVHRVTIGRLRVCVGSIFAFYQIRDENRAKLKNSFSCVHRVSKSARYDATLSECYDFSIWRSICVMTGSSFGVFIFFTEHFVTHLSFHIWVDNVSMLVA